MKLVRENIKEGFIGGGVLLNVNLNLFWENELSRVESKVFLNIENYVAVIQGRINRMVVRQLKN